MARVTWLCTSILLCLLNGGTCTDVPVDVSQDNHYSVNCTTHLLLNNQTCQDMGKPLAYPDYGQLIYSTWTGLGEFDLSTNESKFFIHSRSGSISIMIALHARNRKIFDIFKCNTAVDFSIEEVAKDIKPGNRYFIDASTGQIKVCANVDSLCTAIIHGVQPAAIALHPATGKIYWSDCGCRRSHISRAEMNGKLQVPIVTDNIQCADNIIIDYPNDRLYWVDSARNVIESINLDGTDRKTVLHTYLTALDSIGVSRDRLFWTDSSHETINYCNKSTGEEQGVLLKRTGKIIRMIVKNPALEARFNNPCEDNSCEEICLLAAHDNYTCACSLYKTLGDDGKSCERIKDFNHLIIATGGIFIDYHHTLEDRIYWSRIDTSDHFAEIYNPTNQSLLSNNSQRIFDKISSLYADNGIIGGVAFDHIGNNLYSIDVQQKRIEIMSLVTLENTTLQFSEEPRSILLIPEVSTMFVTFCDKFKCHIDKMSMTGSDRTRFLKDSFKGPRVSLAFDTETERVFWTDQGTGDIESVFLNGTNREMFIKGIIEPVSLAIHGTEVFWTKINSIVLHWADKENRYEQDYDPIHTELYNMHLIPTRENNPLIIAAGKILFGYYPDSWEESYYSINTRDDFAKVYNPTNQSFSNNINQIIFDKISSIYRGNGMIGGVAFDHIGNNLYSINVQQKRIEIMSLMTLENTTLQFSEEPRTILLIPELSIMFVTFCDKFECYIDKMSMTGSERTRFLKDSFKGPRVSLAFDTETERVISADQGTGRIESVSLNGTDMKLLHHSYNHPTSLAIHGAKVFWTQDKFIRLLSINKHYPDRTNVDEMKIGFDIMHLIATRKNWTRKKWSLPPAASGCTDQFHHTAGRVLSFLLLIGFIF